MIDMWAMPIDRVSARIAIKFHSDINRQRMAASVCVGLVRLHVESFQNAQRFNNTVFLFTA
jgi:hypothetical protein